MTTTTAPFITLSERDMNELRDHTRRLSGASNTPYREHRSADKAYGQLIAGAIINGVAAGLWTWAAVACFAAGGGWVVLGGLAAFFAACNVLGCLASIIGMFV